MTQARPRGFVLGDLDGFFGLFIDNLLQLMLIAVLCRSVCGLPDELVTHRILPGAAISVLIGNSFYSWQAWKLAVRMGRDDVTALPYGINTPSMVAYIFLIMGPLYQESKDPVLVWRVGLFACLLSGVLETLGAFAGDWLRRHTPRAALLSSLAGVALTFIALGFIFQIFAAPLLAILPMMLILMAYASRLRLPLGLPGGFAAVLVGVAMAWTLKLLGWQIWQPSSLPYTFGFHPPRPALGDLLVLIHSPLAWRYLSVIFPMALFNLVGSLQNLESAEAAGDAYPTRPSLLANGLCSVLAAFLGSAFPTTIYIGHPGWKAMGARIGYSVLNGTVITFLCLFGGIALVLRVVPIEVTLGILLWIGIVMTAQAFQEVPKRHALAVAVGLIPSLAAWTLLVVETSLQKAGTGLFAVAPKFGNALFIHGVLALNQGFLLSSMIFASVVVFLIERDFLKAVWWTLAAALLSMLGWIHAYELIPQGVQNKFGWAAAPPFAAAYSLCALACFVAWLWVRGRATAVFKDA
jgi:AGZA family xanthine/uracil permease-like MFS transporter